MPENVSFIRANHPLNALGDSTKQGLIRAQREALEANFSCFADLCEQAASQVGIDPNLARFLAGDSPLSAADKPWAVLEADWAPAVTDLGLSVDAMFPLLERVQLLRAFADPDEVVGAVERKVEEIVFRLPRSAADIECGRNPGDVLDPFITAATQELLCSGKMEAAIEATVWHKAMMQLEGLAGHLHEDTLGAFRGNYRVPEPRGIDQEVLDPDRNPFPGADIAQPPLAGGERPRLHQVKSKTGSAKGGDGARLGRQLRLLIETYDADVYYEAMVGTTLRGHRSMAGVLRECPETIVLVGQAAFSELTRSPIGAELLLRVYRRAFREVARRHAYGIEDIGAIVVEFAVRSGGNEFLDVLLRDTTSGSQEEQDSRVFRRARRGPRGL